MSNITNLVEELKSNTDQDKTKLIKSLKKKSKLALGLQKEREKNSIPVKLKNCIFD